MVEIQFMDGTSEIIECGNSYYEYDKDMQCFRILQADQKHYACFPREFVKSIRYIEV